GAVLAVAGREHVVILHGAADADVRRLVAQAAGIGAELAGALQRHRLGVEAADPQHLLEQVHQQALVLREGSQFLAGRPTVRADVLQVFDLETCNPGHRVPPASKTNPDDSPSAGPEAKRAPEGARSRA